MLLLNVAVEIEEASRSSLTSKDEVERQLSTLDALNEKACEVEAQLESLKLAADSITNVVDDASLQSDIYEQLYTTLQAGQELSRRIRRDFHNDDFILNLCI